eukprot:CAMPEP_0182919632 /NCGR_PEP_ID=MMETSP0105_2-20130417/2874_1 /TAXON_ID=81532 ORGANISM="Acanthoeca-like sp., Strain 10tr" /NCGR_SAMPLE_ID=MMETSP0105_2 /ASSEMBLY_ACC=CAM_ASM_000205 /LENGTH=322 /DNA_ID=CAMNT_0025056861 /DNA_START=73 /DNA_END=1037 /DNA_ORIENTATION=-
MAAAAPAAKRAKLVVAGHPADLFPGLAAAREMLIVSPPLDAKPAPKTIGTHDGNFHCDEALACAMLKLLPEWASAAVVRTRDPAAIAECDVVVDVGAVYDAATCRFDHHQKGFEGMLDEIGKATKLSSAGLVYKHYGKEVIAAVAASADCELDVKTLDVLYSRVYTQFVEAIDGIDNGVTIADGELRYKVSTDLSSRVSRLHPGWNEDSSPEIVNECFRQAVLLTGSELVGYIDGLLRGWLPARGLVQQALAAATDDGQVTVLERYCPWQSHLFDLERETKAEGRLKYVLYPDSRGMWRVHAAPAEEGSFKTRRGLPEAWRG